MPVDHLHQGRSVIVLVGATCHFGEQIALRDIEKIVGAVDSFFLLQLEEPALDTEVMRDRFQDRVYSPGLLSDHLSLSKQQ